MSFIAARQMLQRCALASLFPIMPFHAFALCPSCGMVSVINRCEAPWSILAVPSGLLRKHRSSGRQGHNSCAFHAIRISPFSPCGLSAVLKNSSNGQRWLCTTCTMHFVVEVGERMTTFPVDEILTCLEVVGAPSLWGKKEGGSYRERWAVQPVRLEE